MVVLASKALHEVRPSLGPSYALPGELWSMAWRISGGCPVTVCCTESAGAKIGFQAKRSHSVSMEYTQVLEKLKSLSNPEAVSGMARFGINPGHAYGISIPDLRTLAKQIGTDHVLAEKLWSSGIHEARILACMVDDPNEVTEAQLERWVKGFYSWDVCDQCCSNLFDKTEFAYQKATEWAGRGEEFVKRAGFVLMACPGRSR